MTRMKDATIKPDAYVGCKIERKLRDQLDELAAKEERLRSQMVRILLRDAIGMRCGKTQKGAS